MKKLLLALFLVGCGEASSDIDGTWRVTMTVHDGIPCSGDMILADTNGNVSGSWSCLDTKETGPGLSFPPTAPGNFWVTYGMVNGPFDGSTFIANIDGRQPFTDTVTVSNGHLSGAVITGALK